MLVAGTEAMAAPQITVPACDGLTTWAATVDPADTYAVAPALPLPKALADEALLPVFGVTALAWTAEDIKAASGAMVACYKEAKGRGDKPAMDALGVANAVVAKTLGKTLAAVAKARGAVESQRPPIAALPDTAELDRGLAALVGTDPAAPNLQAAAGVPREVIGPLAYIAKFLPYLPDGDRDQLFAELSDRRTAIQTATSQALDAEIATAPADADGVIALLQVRQRIAGMAAGEATAAVDGKAAARIAEIQAVLRQATPAAWVPPDCTDLYRWSGGADAQQGVALGSQSTHAAFLDERVVPVFGLSIGAWSDQDVARFQALRAACQATWRGMPGAQAVANPPADAPELLQLASKGAWIDTADAQIAQARTTIQAYAAALEALAAAEAQVAALPDTPQSLGPLQMLAADPAQNTVDEARRQSFQAMVKAKRDGINAQAMTAAMDGLAQVEVAELGDLVKLIVYWNTAAPTIADPYDQQRFSQAAEEKLIAATEVLLPAFKARLEEMPATLAGFGQTRGAVTELTGVTDTEEVPAFQAMHAAIDDRSLAIVDTMRQENCAALLDQLEIGADDAERLVWDGQSGRKLGIFVCDLTESGSPVHEYAADGMFSDEMTLKATLALGGLQTLSLHEAEVAQGQEMLVGFKLADANQEQPISVQDWAMFTAMATGGRFVTPEECQQVMGKAEDQLSLDDRMMGVDCAEEIINRSWGFQ
jgi:hypothetical protein